MGMGPRDALFLVSRFGLRACAFQATYKLRRKLGWLKPAFPAPAWSERTIAHYLAEPHDADRYMALRAQTPARFFFRGLGPMRTFLSALGEPVRARLLDEAAGIGAGRFSFFSGEPRDLGTPPDWFVNPFTGQRAAADRHWCDLPDFAESQGDIKFIWEASRFGWVYTLARAYALTGDQAYAETFWRWLTHWKAENAPNMGPQWKCGQECAFRLMALCFGLHAFEGSPATTPERVAELSAMVAFHAERIDGNIAYAFSIKNNHGISEALGLLTAGMLFPEFKQAARWKKKGLALLEIEVERQVAPDGSFVQQSHNYHRVMLQDLTWGLRLCDLNGVTVSPTFRERLAAGTRFLDAMLDLESGDVPNYGSNDGALILPLASGGYRDYRPAIQAAYFAATGKRLLPSGPWDEELLWLSGPEALTAADELPPTQSHQALDGGYFTLRGPASWAMIRCHTFKDRPAHADMLHLDLWWNGQNVLRDAGTYQYYGPPWDLAFKQTRVHNTVTVDGRDQMRKGGRFLWLDWTRSRFLRQERLAEGIECWEGEHDGYGAVTHRRSVVRCGEHLWVVIDDLIGGGEHQLDLHWHLLDAPVELRASGLRQQLEIGELDLQIVGVEGVGRHHFGESDGLGWCSLHYGQKAPASSYVFSATQSLPVRIITCIGLGKRVQIKKEAHRLGLRDGEGEWTLDLFEPGASQVVVTCGYDMAVAECVLDGD